MQLLSDLAAYKRTAVLALFLVVMGAGGGGLYLLSLEAQLVEDIALQDAQKSSQALKEFRTLYTSEVVARARAHGMTISHDYAERDDAIPLPATLSMMFGNRMGLSSGVTSKLYSRWPFPWRRKGGGPQDDFEWKALSALRDNPTEAFSRIEVLDGQLVVRYATADLMRPSCVACHNSHPDSPKTDWQVGDVRGVLEVIRPVPPQDSAARSALRNVVTLIAVLVVLGVSALILLASRLRRESVVSAGLAADAIRINRDLKMESAERARAEAQSRELEGQAQRSQKLEGIGLLAGGIAHDFNNLLATVSGNAELAKTSLPEASDARGNILKIEKAALRAKQLTTQLLAYAGRGQFRRMPINLTRMVREIGQLLDTILPPGVNASYKLRHDLAPISGDIAQLQQVAMNLITNAAEACNPPNGNIRISTGACEVDQEFLDRVTVGSDCEPGTYSYLEVEDNGHGIDRENLDKIFDPFFSTKSEGRGLGLAALLGIVRGHLGALIVESIPEGGTRFVVLFPEAEGMTEGSVDVARPESPLNQTILVVDDDDDVRETVSNLLGASGCTVIEAAGGEQALRLLSEGGTDIDAVLLDWQMPGMGGEASLEIFLERKPSLPVLICSGYGDDQDIERLLIPGQVLFLQKPFLVSELLAALRSILNTAPVA
jgi:signal transduction histidine kinase/CheY-like chemotaxis protein